MLCDNQLLSGAGIYLPVKFYQMFFIEMLLSTLQQSSSDSDMYWDSGVQIRSWTSSSKQHFSLKLLHLKYLAISFWGSDIFCIDGKDRNDVSTSQTWLWFLLLIY